MKTTILILANPMPRAADKACQQWRLFPLHYYTFRRIMIPTTTFIFIISHNSFIKTLHKLNFFVEINNK